VLSVITNYSVPWTEYIARRIAARCRESKHVSRVAARENERERERERRVTERSATLVVVGLMAIQWRPFGKALEALGQSGRGEGIARANRSKVIVPST